VRKLYISLMGKYSLRDRIALKVKDYSFIHGTSDRNNNVTGHTLSIYIGCAQHRSLCHCNVSSLYSYLYHYRDQMIH